AVTNCLSITPATRSQRSLTGSPFRSVRLRFSSPSWAPPTSPMSRRAGPGSLADWIGTHTRAFAAIGGVPKLLVPDNTKGAVIKACLYEPQVNRTYAEMAAHYDTAILPARPRRPRDKAKVEGAVLIIERWLLGRL